MWDANPEVWCQPFWQPFCQDCIKMKEIGPKRGRVSLTPSLDPPLKHGEGRARDSDL